MTHEVCMQCDFDGARFDDAALTGAIRDLGPRWQQLLASAGNELRARPAPGVWSAIEYGAHTRDVTALHAWAVEQALTGREPAIPAVAAGLADTAAATYAGADPVEVGHAIAAHTSRLASIAEEAPSGAWKYGFKIGDNRMDVRALLEHALHDSTHHVDDVERGLAQLRAR
jgi:hypothetical protein